MILFEAEALKSRFLRNAQELEFTFNRMDYKKAYK